MFVLGVVAILAVEAALLWGLYSPGHRAEFWRLLSRRWRRPAPPAPPAPEPAEPPITTPPALRDLTPLFGNIATIPAEVDQEPDLTETDTFPPLQNTTTRFAELNWRLICFEESRDTYAEWPIRAHNDFAMRFRGSAEQMLHHVRTRLRPRYVVIVDWDGFWHAASIQLERTPNLQLPLLDAYLGLDPEARPIIVSRVPRANEAAKGSLLCLRYGFADYAFPLNATPPYPTDALTYLFASLTGSKEHWLWFSVARLRAAVLTHNARQEQLRAQLQADAEQNAAVQYENRFAALWKLREAPETRAENPAAESPSP